MRNPGANRDDYGEIPLGISPGEHRLVTILRASLKKGADPSSKKGHFMDSKLTKIICIVSFSYTPMCS